MTAPRLLVQGKALVATTAAVTGDVVLGEDANLWYGVVVRGDDAPISIGPRTNVQDNAVVHVDPGAANHIAEDVTIGHGAICHGVRIERWALIGMGAILLGGSIVREGAVVAAGCLVPEDFEVPPYTLVVGVPARIVRKVDPEERKKTALDHASGYVKRAKEHAAGAWLGR